MSAHTILTRLHTRTLTAALALAVLPASTLIAQLAPAPAASRQTQQFQGTFGKQQVTLILSLTDDIVSNASYQVQRQPPVPIFEGRLIGTTIVLTDADGNSFHLHMQQSDGSAAADFAHAEKLVGTELRAELTLDVTLTRTRPTTP